MESSRRDLLNDMAEYMVIPQDGAGRRDQEEERKKYHNKQADNVIICQKKAVYLV